MPGQQATALQCAGANKTALAVKTISSSAPTHERLSKAPKPTEVAQSAIGRMPNTHREERSTTEAMLVLDDGSFFRGKSFGAPVSVAGEGVFATTMTGYPETLSDPSYRGQILVLTYPLIGNYGVPSDKELDEHGLLRYFESSRPHIEGLIVANYATTYSHWNAVESLGQWLKRFNIPAIYGCDTRAITQLLRTRGSSLAKIVVDGAGDVAFADPYQRNLVDEVSTKTPFSLGKGRHHIVAVDTGVKNNILRFLAADSRFTTTVVPWNHNFNEMEYDGLFLSNGPGDPATLTPLITNIRTAMASTDKPIFGICLGNQLMALAAGGKTTKMKFGNRGVNQPAIDQFTQRVYITSQNHGFQVDQSSLPPDWRPYFINANDYSNEGVVHVSKPWSSVQFHPEARAGPYDTTGMFKTFLDKVIECKTSGLFKGYDFVKSSKRAKVKKVVILGSGGLQIGQAGEFDYSGAQAIKAFREEGISTVLINPNIATIQTSADMADRTYFLPVTRAYVEQVFAQERPDAIVLGFGGQTALNTGLELFNAGSFEKFGVTVLGTQVPAIEITEDRDMFNQALAKVGASYARSEAVNTVNDAVAVAREIGYPVMVRSAFSLGGLGSGVCKDEPTLHEMVTKALATCPQVLVEESLKGWKEVEYEVVRDIYDNTITVCNMENFDPMGIHTGESIVIAPSQTLTNEEYFKLRKVAIDVIKSLGIVGECNIQYALDPFSEQYRVIEVNARLSRSSALASKATGYPLAFVAAKLALGIPLPEIRNAVTKNTTACFEPSLDYCVVKMPRWDLTKFPSVDKRIGTMMKSVGEVMSIGRNFAEAMQKACRMNNSAANLGFEQHGGYADLETELREPTDRRIFAIAESLDKNIYSVEQLHHITKIDPWYLEILNDVSNMKKTLAKYNLKDVPRETLRTAKILGFCDRQIAKHVKDMGGKVHMANELAVRAHRKSLSITPFVKQIDTLAAEFPAFTNYLYVTYDASKHDVVVNDPTAQRVIVLGSGVYRIGSSVEFDFCSVTTARAMRRMGQAVCLINSNPETVSTDYDESDRLYFEELTFERVMDVNDIEIPRGIVVSMGGQEPQNIALSLHRAGARVLGTSPEDIDRAENREKFSTMLDNLKIAQPAWATLASVDEAKSFGSKVGYPVLVRPSYVLSGAAMAVARSEEQLTNMLTKAAAVSPDYPVVMTKFHIGFMELECDAVAQDGQIVNWAIAEHIENAGVHSGDASHVLPADTINEDAKTTVKSIADKIAAELKISGPFNTQFLHNKETGEVMVIETNLRASRSFPFVCKTLGINFLETAARVFLNKPVKTDNRCAQPLPYVCVKAPMFSFMRLSGADPKLSVEMKSTGEVACFGRDRVEALTKAMVGARGHVVPVRGIMLATGARTNEIAENIRRAAVEGGAKLYAADKPTASALKKLGLDFEALPKGITVGQVASENTEPTSAVGMVRLPKEERLIDLVVEFPPEDSFVGNAPSDADVHAHYLLRRSASDFGIGLFTDARLAAVFLDGVGRYNKNPVLPSLAWDEYLKMTPYATPMAHGKSYSV